MAPTEVPPWGTPDGGTPDPVDRPGRAPERGAPGPDPDHGTPDQTPDYGTPPAAGERLGPYPAPSTGPDLLTAPTVVVVEESGFLSIGGYWLTTPDDVRLGSLRREASAAGYLFGSAATTTYRLYDAHDRPIGAMERPGSLGGRSRFVVTDADGASVGTVTQEGFFGAPTLLLTTADELTMRLTGGRFGSREWQLVDGLDESVLMGQVSQEYAGLGGLISDNQRFAVQLSPQLVGDHRLLAVMATVCLDYVRDAKKR